MPAAEPNAGCRLEAAGEGRYLLQGDLGFLTVAAVLENGEREFAGRQRVEVDLSRLTDADSAGLALLIEWTRSARAAGRDIVFRGMPARLEAIARISGVADMLPRVAD